MSSLALTFTYFCVILEIRWNPSQKEVNMNNGKELGEVVCKSIGLDPTIVRSIIIEIYPDEPVTMTIEVSAKSKEVIVWARDQKIMNPDKIVIIEQDEWEMT